jgi:hypothetical protein
MLRYFSAIAILGSMNLAPLVLYMSHVYYTVRTVAFIQQNKVSPNISGFYFCILQGTIFGIFCIESARPKIRDKICTVF